MELYIETSVPINDEERKAIQNHPSAKGAWYASVVESDDAEGELLVAYHYKPMRFDRIRRITGYLTGTLDTWNDAKRAEERDRVKHLTSTTNAGDL